MQIVGDDGQLREPTDRELRAYLGQLTPHEILEDAQAQLERQVTTVREQVDWPTCATCRHSGWLVAGYALCRNPVLTGISRDAVSGEVRPGQNVGLERARSSSGACGPSGQLWEPAPPEPVLVSRGIPVEVLWLLVAAVGAVVVAVWVLSHAH